MEFKLCLLLAEVDFRGEFVAPDALSASCASFSVVPDNCLRLNVLLGLSDVFYVKDAHRANPLKFLCIFSDDWFSEPNVRQVAVECSADGRPLRVGLANSLLANEFHFYFLARPELGDQDVVVKGLGLRDALRLKSLLLVADRDPLKVA